MIIFYCCFMVRGVGIVLLALAAAAHHGGDHSRSNTATMGLGRGPALQGGFPRCRSRFKLHMHMGVRMY